MADTVRQLPDCNYCEELDLFPLHPFNISSPRRHVRVAQLLPALPKNSGQHPTENQWDVGLQKPRISLTDPLVRDT